MSESVIRINCRLCQLIYDPAKPPACEHGEDGPRWVAEDTQRIMRCTAPRRKEQQEQTS